jgi:hypothetical protein
LSKTLWSFHNNRIAVRFQYEYHDVNCPQHIHKRFLQKQVASVIEQLQAKIAELETKLKMQQTVE